MQSADCTGLVWPCCSKNLEGLEWFGLEKCIGLVWPCCSRNLEGLERFGLEKSNQLTAVLEALLYTEAGGGAPMKDVDQVKEYELSRIIL